MNAYDVLTQAGAEKLARDVRGYWLERGYDAEVRVERAEAGHIGHRTWPGHYAVRSDLINGRPRRKVE